MHKLLILLVLLPSVAIAQLLPNGCYVAYNNPGTCYNVPNSAQILVYTSLYNNQLYYGDVVGELAYRGYSCNIDRISLQQELRLCSENHNLCSSNFDLCINQRNEYLNSYNASQTNYAGYVTGCELRKSLDLKLIKRLRKACGKKCNKIK